MGVSILVFVELALDDPVVSISRLTTRVSILVFVELALDDLPRAAYKSEHDEFQSLFSWNLLLMSSPGSWFCSMLWFQSLFSWNLLLMSQGSDEREYISRFPMENQKKSNARG